MRTGLEREIELPKRIMARTDTRTGLEINALSRLELESNKKCDKTVGQASGGRQKLYKSAEANVYLPFVHAGCVHSTICSQNRRRPRQKRKRKTENSAMI